MRRSNWSAVEETLTKINNRIGTWIAYSLVYFLSNRFYLTALTLLPFAILPFYIAYSSQRKLNYKMGNITQRAAAIYIPAFLRRHIYGYYSKKYNVNVEEMEKPFVAYKTFSAFFTRSIKPRPIDQPSNAHAVCSPVDGKILSIEQITQDQCFVIKGAHYNLGELILGKATELEDSLLLQLNKGNKLYHVVIYLGPGNYHHVHSPAKCRIRREQRIDGERLEVNEKAIVENENTYGRNARICLHGTWGSGYLGMVLVGAKNVSNIHVEYKDKLEKGEEIGYFDLGSTVVLLLEAKGKIKWAASVGQQIKYGEKLCEDSA